MAKVSFYLSTNMKPVEVNVKKGTTLLEAASQSDIQVNSICGGDGICGRCRVLVQDGKIEAKSTPLLSREEIKEGYVLACQTKVLGDVEVEVPPGSIVEEGQILIDEDAQRFKALHGGAEETFYRYAPLIKKYYLQLPSPTLKDNIADHRRIYRAIRRREEIPIMQAGLKVIREIPQLIRKYKWKVTATLGRRGDTTEVIQVEGGDTSKRNYGIAVDVGTTTVVAHLVDLTSTKTLDTEAKYNSQIKYGEEITRRIIYADENGPQKLQEAIVGDINNLISVMVGRNQVELNQVTSVICSGNTAMLHFLLGLETTHIRKSPYVPTSTNPPPIRAAEVGIRINPRGLLYSMPHVGGWVGGDITSGILACGINRSDKLTIFIDIGTNGEILIGNKDWMLSASASAGPAFEGTGAKSGMRASRGAIERVEISDGDLQYSVIGGGEPEGICGSGLIDLVAELFKAGVIDRTGELNTHQSDRVRETDGQLEFVVAPSSQIDGKNDIVITQPDIENLIRAKAAIYAGANILMKSLDLEFEQVDQLFIAGGFGSYIDKRKARILGLIPDVPLEKIKFVGNTSITGAKMALLSREALATAQEISRSVTYYDLIDYPNYFDEFMAAKFLPHTDLNKFPSVSVHKTRSWDLGVRS